METRGGRRTPDAALFRFDTSPRIRLSVSNNDAPPTSPLLLGGAARALGTQPRPIPKCPTLRPRGNDFGGAGIIGPRRAAPGFCDVTFLFHFPSSNMEGEEQNCFCDVWFLRCEPLAMRADGAMGAEGALG